MICSLLTEYRKESSHQHSQKSTRSEGKIFFHHSISFRQHYHSNFLQCLQPLSLSTVIIHQPLSHSSKHYIYSVFHSSHHEVLYSLFSTINHHRKRLCPHGKIISSNQPPRLSIVVSNEQQRSCQRFR